MSPLKVILPIIFVVVVIQNQCEQNDKGHLLFSYKWCMILKVSKSRKQFMVSTILQKTKENNLTWGLIVVKLIFFCSFFGRIEVTINCFRDLLTFNKLKIMNVIGIDTFGQKVLLCQNASQIVCLKLYFAFQAHFEFQIFLVNSKSQF